MTPTENKITQHGIEELGRFYSLYEGKIASVDDPKRLGRVRIGCGRFFGQKSSKWAIPLLSYTGGRTSLITVPKVGDDVLLGFMMGDLRFPFFLPFSGDQQDWYRQDAPDSVVLRLDDSHVRLNGSDGSILLHTPNIVLHVKDGKISLGSLDNSAEPAVLGDTLKGKLDTALDHLESLRSAQFDHATTILAWLVSLGGALAPLLVHPILGPLAVAINGTLATPVSNLPTVIASLAALQGQIAALKASLPQILSNKITLD